MFLFITGKLLVYRVALPIAISPSPEFSQNIDSPSATSTSFFFFVFLISLLLVSWLNFFFPSFFKFCLSYFKIGRLAFLDWWSWKRPLIKKDGENLWFLPVSCMYFRELLHKNINGTLPSDSSRAVRWFEIGFVFILNCSTFHLIFIMSWLLVSNFCLAPLSLRFKRCNVQILLFAIIGMSSHWLLQVAIFGYYWIYHFIIFVMNCSFYSQSNKTVSHHVFRWPLFETDDLVILWLRPTVCYSAFISFLIFFRPIEPVQLHCANLLIVLSCFN